MLKKLVSLLMMLTLVLSIPALAYAEENETINETTTVEESDTVEDETTTEEDEEVEVTEREVEELSDRDGAEVRIRKLIHRLDIRIENANKVIDRILEANTTIDVEALEEIVDEFVIIKEDLENLALDGASDYLAQEYVAAKKAAIDLSKKFKETVKAGLNDEQKLKIRDEINKRKAERLKEDIKDLREARNRYVFKQIVRLENHYEFGNEISEQLKNGEITFEEAKKLLRAKISELPEEDRKEIAGKVREEKKKLEIRKKEEINKLRKDALRIAKERVKIINKRAKDSRTEFKKTLEGLSDEQINTIKKDLRQNKEKYLEEFKKLKPETQKKVKAAVAQRIKKDGTATRAVKVDVENIAKVETDANTQEEVVE